MKNYRSPTYYELAAPPELDWRSYRPQSYLHYREEWDRRGQQGDASDFPLHLDIDPTNRCNLRCTMCPRTYYLEHDLKDWAPGGLGDMDMALFDRLLTEGASKGLKSVKLNFLGEPLLHPKLSDMVAKAASLGLWVMINTNAVALTPELSHRLLDAGLTDIFFSFDSPYPTEYERIRVGARFSSTIENIATFMKIKNEMGLKAVQTRASMVLSEKPGDYNQIKEDYIRLFRDLKVAEIGFGLPSDPSRDYSSLGPINFTCPDLFRRMFVFHDGLVGPCCGDWERRLLVGDAKTENISEIWNGQKYQALREKHLLGKYTKVMACQRCSVPYLSTLEVSS